VSSFKSISRDLALRDERMDFMSSVPRY